MEYQIKIGIKAGSQPTAIKVAEALTDIRNALTDEELFELRQILMEKPGIVQTAKMFLGKKK